MVCHLVLCKLRQGISPEEVEEIMRRTRMSLLKIDAALTVRCGRAIARDEEWEFFVAVEAHSMERLAAYRDHAIYVKYMEEVLKPSTECRVALDYEMDPARLGYYASA